MFEGIKVLDFTRAFAGPFCTQMLAELVADVIKIEQPNLGDETRTWEPIVNGWSGYFMSLNRSKRSITLDLKAEESNKIIESLIREADVIVENFSPGVVNKLGISYEDAKRINSKIIYLSISAYGQNGPNKNSRGYDPMMQADTGVMSITGNKGGEPVKVMIPISDISAGMYGGVSIASALYKRSVSGEGEYIDLALYDSTVSWMGIIAAMNIYKGEVPGPLGSEHLHRAPSRNYITKDGSFIHLVSNDSQWLKLCELLGLDSIFKNEPYLTNGGRIKEREIIDEVIQEALLKKNGKEWVVLAQEKGVPCALINTIDDVLKSEQTKSRELLVSWEQDGLGKATGLNYPYKFLNAKTKVRKPVPKLGEHTKTVLEDLGFSKEEINELYAKKVI